MADSSSPPETAPPVVTPDGSLGLLAVGYRGIVAWREARGPGWIDALGLPPLPETPAAPADATAPSLAGE